MSYISSYNGYTGEEIQQQVNGFQGRSNQHKLFDYVDTDKTVSATVKFVFLSGFMKAPYIKKTAYFTTFSW